ncbi:tripartite tricarboxylate transporter TctB family protein [Halegenticoccus tardaugens]|uniref:tripartite tricarboxylate transporter TctB family protein n=1 Tax=Halegenticoccus tardaugens TaxID=2071624 RepID=UPI00100B8120|nr:tripartite tricarboxylate transporter TctB family protein [Halegenticoccus tardaugens]
MTFEELYRQLTEEMVDQETVLTAILVVSSGFMLWESTNFEIESATRFPRLTASVVFVGSVLLLCRNYLPGWLRDALVSSGGMFEASDEFTEHQEEREEEQVTGETTDEASVSTAGRPIHDSMFTSVSVIGYALVGYTIGLLWATPLFVAAYGIWFRLPWLYTGMLTVIGFGIAYSFMIVLNVPMDSGAFVLMEGIPWIQ